MKHLPNLLCWFRIAAIPVILLFLLSNGWTAGIAPDIRIFVSGILFGVAMITDFLDGKIARRYGLTSDFGKVLDQIADKVLISGILVAMVSLGYVPAVPVVIILAREFLVSGLRMGVSAKGHVVPANLWGKLKTTAQSICIGAAFLLLFLNLQSHSETYFLLIDILFWLVAGYTAISAIPYYIQCKKYLKGQ